MGNSIASCFTPISTIIRKICNRPRDDNLDIDSDKSLPNLATHLAWRLVQTTKELQQIIDTFAWELPELGIWTEETCRKAASHLMLMRTGDEKELMRKHGRLPRADVLRALHQIRFVSNRMRDNFEKINAPTHRPGSVKLQVISRLRDAFQIYERLGLICDRLALIGDLLDKQLQHGRETPPEFAIVRFHHPQDPYPSLKEVHDLCVENAYFINRLLDPDDERYKALSESLGLLVSWGVSLFEDKPYGLDKLLSLQPEATESTRQLLLRIFTRILIFAERWLEAWIKATEPQLSKVFSSSTFVDGDTYDDRLKELGDAKTLKENTSHTLTARELIYPAVAMCGGSVAKVTTSSGTQKAWASTKLSVEAEELVNMVQRLYDVVDTLWYERARLCTLMAKANPSPHENTGARTHRLWIFTYDGLHLDVLMDADAAQDTKQVLEAWVRHRQGNISAPLANIVELFLERQDKLATIVDLRMDRSHFSSLGNHRLFREQFCLCYWHLLFSLFHLVDDEDQGEPEDWEEGAVVLADGFVRDFYDLLMRVDEVWNSVINEPNQTLTMDDTVWEARATRSLESSLVELGQ